MNQHRAVYQPLLETVSDYEDEEDEAETGRSRLPLLIVLALTVLALFAGVVWLAYNQGVARGRSGEPVLVAAPDGPVRTQPADGSVVATPYLGLKVYQEPVPPDSEVAGTALAQTPTVSPELAQQLQVPSAPPAPATTEAPPARLNLQAPAAAAAAPQAPVAAPPPAAAVALPPPAAAKPAPAPAVAAAPAAPTPAEIGRAHV